MPSARKPRSSPPPPENRLVARHCAGPAVGRPILAKAGAASKTAGAVTRLSVVPRSAPEGCVGTLRDGSQTRRSTVFRVEVSNAVMSQRPQSTALDAILGIEHPVLNHGFIRVVDYMGGDDAVVQAARVSYGT